LYLLNFRQFPKFALLAGLMVCASPPAWAWGPEGHEIVALVALHELTPSARSQVTRLLGGAGTMVQDSNWADEIRDQRRDTGRWHFVDIPLNAPGYDPRRDCASQDCVVAQIEKDQHILANTKLGDGARAEALRFLIHFVADAHQPLHAEDNGDKGGNDIKVYAGRRRSSLHRVWDSDVAEALGRDPEMIADNIERSVSPAQRKAWAAGTPAQWANEAHAIARDQIYPPLMNRHELRLPRDYAFQEAPLARVQLAKAGVRLAWLLNTTLK
jgi:hypothetical protein